jgi:signal transduction histidine kinase
MNNPSPDHFRNTLMDAPVSKGNADGSLAGPQPDFLQAAKFILEHPDFTESGQYLFVEGKNSVLAECGYLSIDNEQVGNPGFFISDACFQDANGMVNLPREILELQSGARDSVKPVVVNEARLLPGLRNFLLVPVISGEDFFGFLAYGNRKSDFTLRDMSVAESFAELVGLAYMQHKRERELKIACRQAEESDRMKSAFISNMSHEIRTPLNSILGFSDLLSEPDLDPSDRLKYIRIINKNGDQLMSIINNVLDISLIESNRIRLYREPTDPGEVIREVYELFQAPGLIKKNVRYAIDYTCPDTVRLMTDRARLHQILVNLMANAIKFTAEGHVIINCHEREASGGKEIVMSVEDTGTGIPKDQLLKIFDRFRQADLSTTRKLGGFGLGLAISRGLTELLGGRIEVESEIGVGSTFRVIFPYPESTGVPE